MIGHTVQKYGKITTRCDHKVVLIDGKCCSDGIVGISSVYGGNAAALEINGDILTSLYPSKKDEKTKRVRLNKVKKENEEL